MKIANIFSLLRGVLSTADALDRKGWWKSKTVWVQIFSLALTGAGMVFGPDLGLEVSDAEAAAVAAVNIATIVARWNGDKALAARPGKQ